MRLNGAVKGDREEEGRSNEMKGMKSRGES